MLIMNLLRYGCGEWLVKYTRLEAPHGDQERIHEPTFRFPFYFSYFSLPKNHDLLSGGVPSFVTIWAFCYETFFFNV